MRLRHLRSRWLVGVPFVVLPLLVGACAQDDPPEVPAGADAALEQGREVWADSCARCHGADGGGGSGVKLSDGRAEELHPEIDTMIDVIAEGRGAMPSFSQSLDPDEIEAVARYVREVL
ncbi:c-type cytochrome [Actinomarinicola tropica]|nr:cytochrome c [Actinomarinicola tropica]